MSNQTKDRGHSALGASSSDRWMACPGSVALIETVPWSSISPAAEEGTGAHEAAALCLQEGLRPIELVGRFFNKYEVTEEMAEALDVYVDFVGQTVARLPGSTLYVERPFDLSFIRPDMWGTNDASVSQPFGELCVIDYKHGQGVVVEVKDNPQLLYYALGALEETQDDPETIKMVIVQPRARHADGPIREWVVTADYVYEWGERELGPAADRARQPGAKLHAGEHCRWCNAAGVCPELKQYVVDEAKMDFAEAVEGKPMAPQIPSAEEDLGRAMRALPVVENWCKAVSAAAQQRLESGQALEGFKLVRSRANRKWKDEKKVRMTFKTMRVPIKEYMSTPKLVSPAQAEKLQKVSKEVVVALCEKPEGKATIVSDSDPRPEIAPPAETDFEVVTIEVKLSPSLPLDEIKNVTVIEEDFLA